MKQKAQIKKLKQALNKLLWLVSNVLTDSQLDHIQCGQTIRKTYALIEIMLRQT